MATPAFVDIPGLGRVPRKFSYEFDGVDIDNGADVNGHHEGRVRLSCGEENWGPNDDFNVSGWQTRTGYQLDIYINSEARVGLYDGGRVVLDYNQTTQRWSIKGYVPGRESRREWLFCDANAVIDVVTGGLDCFKASLGDRGLQDSIERITQNLKDDRTNITASAAPYKGRNDCTEAPTDPQTEASTF